MKCDIVILSKSNNLLEKCLSALSMHASLSSIGKVLVGWTGAPEEAKFTHDLPGLVMQVVQLSRYNFAANNNYIVKNFCTSEAVLFMNDDVVLEEDSISKCLKHLQDDELLGSVGIRLLHLDGKIQHDGQFVAFCAGKFAGVGHIGYNELAFSSSAPSYVIGNTGAFLMCRRKDFLAVGGFDESFKHSLEDVKLNLEFLKQGKMNMCDTTTWAWHAESQTRKQASCKEDMMHLRDFIESNMHMFSNLVCN